MARNEKTSKRVLRIASDLLRNSRSSKVRTVTASVLTQGPDRKKRR